MHSTFLETSRFSSHFSSEEFCLHANTKHFFCLVSFPGRPSGELFRLIPLLLFSKGISDVKKREKCAFKLRLNSLLLRNDVTRPFAAAAAYAPCGICASTKRKLKHFMLYSLAFTPAGLMMPSNSSDEKCWHAQISSGIYGNMRRCHLP